MKCGTWFQPGPPMSFSCIFFTYRASPLCGAVGTFFPSFPTEELVKIETESKCRKIPVILEKPAGTVAKPEFWSTWGGGCFLKKYIHYCKVR